MSEPAPTRPRSPGAKRIALVILASIACGCTMFGEIYDEQRLDDWARDNELLAESGRIGWADYYSQYLQKASATPMADQGLVVERLGILLAASRLFEEGRLDRNGFDAVRAVMRAYQTTDEAAANMMAREVLVRALQNPKTAATSRSSTDQSAR
jgi:hypothetical protein